MKFSVLFIICLLMPMIAFALDEQDVRGIDRSVSSPQIPADSWMYGFKRFGETMTDFFTFDLQQKIKLHTLLLKERIAEIRDFEERGKDIAVIIEDYRNELNNLNNSIEKSGLADIQMIKNSSDSIERSIIVLQLVYQKVPDNAKLAVERAINNSIEHRAFNELKYELLKENVSLTKIKDKIGDEIKTQREIYRETENIVKAYYLKGLENRVLELDRKISDSKDNKQVEELENEKKVILQKIEQLYQVKYSECSTDDNCVVAGCSAQLCVPVSRKDIITTCEYKQEYECLQKTSCRCVNNKCQWNKNDEYNKCLIEATNSSIN